MLSTILDSLPLEVTCQLAFGCLCLFRMVVYDFNTNFQEMLMMGQGMNGYMLMMFQILEGL